VAVPAGAAAVREKTAAVVVAAAQAAPLSAAGAALDHVLAEGALNVLDVIEGAALGVLAAGAAQRQQCGEEEEGAHDGPLDCSGCSAGAEVVSTLLLVCCWCAV